MTAGKKGFRIAVGNDDTVYHVMTNSKEDALQILHEDVDRRGTISQTPSDVIDIREEDPAVIASCLISSDRALYHSGRLCEDCWLIKREDMTDEELKAEEAVALIRKAATILEKLPNTYDLIENIIKNGSVRDKKEFLDVTRKLRIAALSLCNFSDGVDEFKYQTEESGNYLMPEGKDLIDAGLQWMDILDNGDPLSEKDYVELSWEDVRSIVMRNIGLIPMNK